MLGVGPVQSSAVGPVQSSVSSTSVFTGELRELPKAEAYQAVLVCDHNFKDSKLLHLPYEREKVFAFVVEPAY